MRNTGDSRYFYRQTPTLSRERHHLYYSDARWKRRYDVQGYIDAQTETDIVTIGYCRVRGKSQSDDLASQVAYLQKHYPEAEIIQDFGSGINFNRKGFRTLLECILRGDKLRIVVAHRD